MNDKEKVNPVAVWMEWTAWIGKALVIVLLAAFLNAAARAAHFSLLQQGIAEEVLRFHVLANSDSEEDQAVKYLVRDEVLNWISKAGNENLSDGYLPAHETDFLMAAEDTLETDASESEAGTGIGTAAQNSREDLLQFLTDNTDQIEETANAVLIEQNLPYRATAEITWSYFPDRTYGDCTFPAGWYQALRIRLGAAAGHNWWCLLYPGLCFTDVLHAVVDGESQEKLEEVLTVEEYQSLLKRPGEWKISFRWF